MELEQKYEYKSPIAALLWSIMMTGFGQFYNGQYIFGTLLFLFEIIANGFSSINTSILHSFHGDTESAHDIFNHQWGLFYPSTYAFGIWHAYNKAIILNSKQENKAPVKRTHLTGFFVAFVIGMNIGIYYHHLLDKIPYLSLLSSPIFNGLLWGIILGCLGHLVERCVRNSKMYNRIKVKE
ncbi:hypothetical protein [Paucisalibacillus globulus]|uniref:hypothetical protein n=1 Tax=Paucisalibacillus globulus TaxID=351095 RepID=UPI00041F07C4|nr:hypothetical protein [Paucisalibacillus globulus]